jgi:hypothetical protein
MNVMTVRGKTYCEIAPKVWESCLTNRMNVTTNLDPLYFLLLLLMGLLAMGIEVRKARLSNCVESVNRSLRRI